MFISLYRKEREKSEWTKRIRKMMPGCLTPTRSEPLNPCPCLPGAVPRLRPWLEEYCLQLEQLRRPRMSSRAPRMRESCPVEVLEKLGGGSCGERKEGRDELRAPREWSLCVGYR